MEYAIQPRNVAGFALSTSDGPGIPLRDMLVKVVDEYGIRTGKRLSEGAYVGFNAILEASGILADGQAPKRVQIAGKMRGRTETFASPCIRIYKPVGRDHEPEAQVESYGDGLSEVVKAEVGAHWLLDLSSAAVPKRCTFLYPMLYTPNGLKITQMSVVGVTKLLQPNVDLRVEIVQRG